MARCRGWLRFSWTSRDTQQKSPVSSDTGLLTFDVAGVGVVAELENANVFGSRSLRAFAFGVFDTLTLPEVVKARIFDSGAVKEEFAAGLARDESETLVRDELLDSSLSHCWHSLKNRTTKERKRNAKGLSTRPKNFECYAAERALALKGTRRFSLVSHSFSFRQR